MNFKEIREIVSNSNEIVFLAGQGHLQKVVFPTSVLKMDYLFLMVFTKNLEARMYLNYMDLYIEIIAYHYAISAEEL